MGDGNDSFSITGQALNASLAKFVLLGVGILSTIIFARLLGVKGFGEAIIAVFIATMLDRPLYGWAVSVKKRLSEGSVGAPQAGPLFLSLSLGLVMIYWSVYVAIYHLFGFQQYHQTAWYALLLLSSNSLFVSSTPVLEGKGKIGFSNWLSTARSGITLPIQLLLLLIIGDPMDSMIYGIAVAGGIIFTISMLSISITLELPTLEQYKSCYQYAKYSVFSITIKSVVKRLDIFILTIFVAPTAVGLYEVAWRISVPVSYLGQTISAGMMTKVSSNVNLDPSALQPSLNASTLLTYPMLFGSIAIGPGLLATVFGPEYSSAHLFLMGVIIYRMLRTLELPQVAIIEGLDRPDLALRGHIVMGILNLILSSLLAIYLGGIGVVVGTILSEIAFVIYSTQTVATTYTRVHPSLSSNAYQCISAVAMGIVVYFARMSLTPLNLAELVIILLLGASSYISTVVWLGSKSGANIVLERISM